MHSAHRPPRQGKRKPRPDAPAPKAAGPVAQRPASGISPKLRSEMQIGVVASRFNPKIVGVMVEECGRAMRELGIRDDLRRFVPGALELPYAAQCLALEDDDEGEPLFHGLIALGCVIRGETHHFEVVANTSAAGLMQVQLEVGLPVVNGVLTVDTEAQALARAKGKARYCVEAVADLVATFGD